ncbi:LIM domain transcription factor LMO4.1, partial [Takifugu flavidus]
VAMVNSRLELPAVSVVGGCSGARSCAGCGGRITDRFLLFSMERYWHTRCLRCSCCHAELGEFSRSCYSRGGMILCKDDYIRLFGHTGACSACGQTIPPSEMVMRAQGSVYHLKCFTCATCRNRLVPGDRFHYINGSIFCEHDHPGPELHGGHAAPLQASGRMSEQKLWLQPGPTFLPLLSCSRGHQRTLTWCTRLRQQPEQIPSDRQHHQNFGFTTNGRVDVGHL